MSRSKDKNKKSFKEYRREFARQEKKIEILSKKDESYANRKER